jgi:hypothetical protein
MHFTKDVVQLPHEILTGFRENWPHVQLHLSSNDCFSVLVAGLPTSNITTIRFTPPRIESNLRDELRLQDLQLKDCIISSPNLTHLTTKLECPFDPSKGRLPPIKNLIVEGDSRWTYSYNDARRIWNFSRLDALYLENLSFETFTRSVLPTDFPKLHTIRLFQKCSNSLLETFGACKLLGKFLQELPLIEVISVLCYNPGDVIDGFSTPKPSVRLLHVRYYSQDIVCTLELSHIRKIDCTFPGLRDLFVDIKYYSCDSEHLNRYMVSSIYRTY